MMLVALLWLALFFETLESLSFTPTIISCQPTTTTTSPSPLFASSVNDVTSESIQELNGRERITITLPPFAAMNQRDACQYPSVLHHLHIQSLLSQEEASKACQMAHDFAASTGRWLKPDSERHQSYATCDFPVEDCETLQDFLDEVDFDGRLFKSLSDLYNIEMEDLSYLDLFVAHYQAKTDNNDNPQIMDRLEAHRDGSILAFSLLLNSPDDFEGGGTFYEALRDVPPSFGVLHAGGTIRPQKAGDAVMHCGKILHGADVVTSGSRTVLVGFVDVSERCQRPGVLSEACKEWGRVDVVKYRFERQESKGHQGWLSNNSKFFHGDASSSAVKGFLPALQGVIRRNNPELCRRRRLEAEDVLLRNILLPSEERSNDVFDGDISILDINFEDDPSEA
ncbi:hypothetical protein IV203_004048 [Nitzschia inconspicua]|uniref:Fe2OG dioxygenase domain-containing protein n=1 Tax=Nitzschia inconspicua TaxID=303405 RepID=A0A9K3L362_9STRA|nr:hypothetical protein IV203_004048 [Nitzschia inconspicua]